MFFLAEELVSNKVEYRAIPKMAPTTVSTTEEFKKDSRLRPLLRPSLLLLIVVSDILK
jgi:hypothetical protein